MQLIAEISSNHNQDLERCKILIEKACEIGCTGVKFQLFKLDQLFAQEILLKSECHRRRKEWELPEEFVPELSTYAKKLGLSFGCTPFYLDAIKILKQYVDYFKISSYELLWQRLIKECGNTGKPMVLSTGMANLQEVQDALKTVQQTDCKEITLLQCNSAYPTPLNDVNLEVIDTYRDIGKKIFLGKSVKLKYGYSDHTVSPAVIYRAVHRYNVDFIEFHIDLDEKGVEYSSGHCWLPENIKEVIQTVKDGFLSDGFHQKFPTPTELPDRSWRADPSDGLRPMRGMRKEWEN